MKFSFSSLFVLTSVTVLFNACKKDESTPEPELTSPSSSYTQYGTPFNNIPETEDVVMYEVNMRAYSAQGNLQGVINRLDQIQDLGVNVIWLMPIYTQGQLNSVGSPYCIKDYKSVSPEYGDLNTLRTLVDGAHERGMAVMLDWVANHTSWDNGWMSHPSWYTQDGSGNIIIPPGTNWQDVAELNYNNMEMQDAMIDAMKYWAYEANIDGFRCDYADGVPFEFWQRAITSIREIPYREFLFFAEGSRPDHFDAGFNMNFGWTFYGAVENVFNGYSTNTLLTANTTENTIAPSGKAWVRFTTNHDESAWNMSPISMFGSIPAATAASVVTIYTGGVPLIYGSQEVGTASTVPFFTNSTINWNANPTMLQDYKDMLQAYNVLPAARRGTLSNLSSTDIFCIRKNYNNESVVVITNVRNATINFNVPISLQNTTWTNAINGESITLGSTLSLPPYEYFILKN